MLMEKQIISLIEESMNTKKSLPINLIEDACNILIECYKNGRKVLICGNGGSAADSQHMAAELMNKFKLNRDPLPCVALTTDSSILTSIGNDFGYEYIFEKQVKAIGQEGDVLIAISTSGNSENVIKAIDAAKEKRMFVIGLMGDKGGKMKGKCNLEIIVHSANTPRVQESHILIIHIICEIIEKWSVNKESINN